MASLNLRDEFSDFGGRSWINCSHQGALPLRAAAAARRAVEWKLEPRHMTTERFSGVPARLRELLGRLVGAPPDDIVLANGASYGLHLMANGLPLHHGDEVLVMKGDFPSNVLPWLGLERDGIRVRILEPVDVMLGPGEIEDAITPRTRVLCMSWVHSFSGRVADLHRIGEICRERGVVFIANTTQGVGARPLDLASTPVDSIVNAGWKWLCGPYATGFSVLRPAVRESLTTNQSYWLSTFTAEDLSRDELELRADVSADARRFDLYATADFFNSLPWTASLELVNEIGVENIAAHDQALVSRLLDGIDETRYRVTSPRRGEERSTLVFLTHRDASRNSGIHGSLAAAGVDVALRSGQLRLSPHLYNAEDDIDRALDVLHRV